MDIFSATDKQELSDVVYSHFIGEIRSLFETVHPADHGSSALLAYPLMLYSSLFREGLSEVVKEASKVSGCCCSRVTQTGMQFIFLTEFLQKVET